jgi:hypothetical protein
MAGKKNTTSKNPMAGTRVKAAPKGKREIGIDTNNQFASQLVDSALSSMVDISKLDGFLNATQTREQTYKLIDTMSDDPILASYLKTIAEDSVETNDSGQVVWCESDDSNCAKYVTYLLDSLNVDKNAYRWIYSLYKYGDVYLRLYRESDYNYDGIFGDDKARGKESLNESADKLKESVKINLHDASDHYVHYVDMVPNPGEMFELTRFGKTMGYVRAPSSITSTRSSGLYGVSAMAYKMKRSDVDVYGATEFVHGCLEDNSSRTPEEVDIIADQADYDSDDSAKAYTYQVKRGQSELASVFKIWRQLSLLENSALLNRITKSSIIRTIQVNVGDMPKEQVQAHLTAVKNLMEQKTALDAGESMSEYNNPGPMENNIYIPVRSDGIGSISSAQIGGDFDPKQLTDISYFQDKLFGALGIPKAFFGVTDDGAGFNGGTSLAIQSSRYGKSVKRVQNTFCQMITDLVNLLLIDKGLTSYINMFTIRMQAPVTQEELDRRDDKKNRIGVVQDVMNQLGDMSNPVIKMKILKSLLASSINDVGVIDLLQQQIDELEKAGEEVSQEEEAAAESSAESASSHTPEASAGEPEPMPKRTARTHGSSEPKKPAEPYSQSSSETPSPTSAAAPSAPSEPSGGSGSGLPTPNDIGIDFTDNTQF